MRSNQEKKLNCRQKSRTRSAVLDYVKLFLTRGGFLIFAPKRTGQKILILLIIFSWIFAGWPQIFNFPPGIQVARADTATKTWSFDADTESWTASTPNPNNTTASWQSADGLPSPPDGSLQMQIIGKNKTDTGRIWEIAGTWETIFGIPANSTVTEVGSGTGNSYNYRVSEYTTGAPGNSGPFEFYDNTPTLQGAFSAATAFSGTVAWTAKTGAAISVPAGLQASNNTVRFRITNDLATGNNQSAAVTLRQDQIVLTITYTLSAGSITADIVDGSYVSVGSPTMAMNTATFSFTCQTVTGSFGTASQQIYVDNDSGANNGWTLTLAAQAATDVWDSAGTDYDFNDPTSSGCTDGADSPDTLGGQMTVDPSVATLAVGQCGSCTTGNISKGTSAAFDEGATDTITLLDALAASDDVGDWTLQGVSISQKIPAEQPAASDYSIDMVLTVAVN